MSTILQKFSTHKVKFLCISSSFGIYNLVEDITRFCIAVQLECAFDLLHILYKVILLQDAPLAHCQRQATAGSQNSSHTQAGDPGKKRGFCSHMG